MSKVTAACDHVRTFKYATGSSRVELQEVNELIKTNSENQLKPELFEIFINYCYGPVTFFEY